MRPTCLQRRWRCDASLPRHIILPSQSPCACQAAGASTWDLPKPHAPDRWAVDCSLATAWRLRMYPRAGQACPRGNARAMAVAAPAHVLRISSNARLHKWHLLFWPPPRSPASPAARRHFPLNALRRGGRYSRRRDGGTSMWQYQVLLLQSPPWARDRAQALAHRYPPGTLFGRSVWHSAEDWRR